MKSFSRNRALKQLKALSPKFRPIPFSPWLLVPSVLVMVLTLVGCDGLLEDEPTTTTSTTSTTTTWVPNHITVPRPVVTTVGPEVTTAVVTTIPGDDVPVPEVPHDECCTEETGG